MSLQEEELTITGNLLTFTLFEERLTKNFLIINSKLRKLQTLLELENKTKQVEKQLKFLGMKVDTIVEKLPKEGGSLGKPEIKLIAKEQMLELLNSHDDKVVKSKFNLDIMEEFKVMRREITGITLKGMTGEVSGNNAQSNSPVKTSFTAGQAYGSEVQKKAGSKEALKDSLKECLDQEEMDILSKIVEGEDGGEGKLLTMQDVSSKFDQLYTKIEQLRMGKGFNLYLERETEKFEKYEQYEQKSRQTNRKIKPKLQMEGIKQANVRGQQLKNELYSQVQKVEMLKQGMKPKSLLPSNIRKQVQYNTVEKSEKKPKPEQFTRTRSIRKLRLKVDDTKDINEVLREVEMRIQGKVSHEIFMGFIKDFQQKIQILKYSRDATAEIGELKRSLMQLEGRLGAVINYIQTIASEDEALLVKKQWTCISCDKNLQKYNAKVGTHLNWDNLNSKKMSPTKVGAFGQTGQLANKIKSLMEGQTE